MDLGAQSAQRTQAELIRKDLADQRLTDAIRADLERKARLLAVRDVGLQTFDDEAFEVVDLTRAAKALGVLGLSRPASGALLPPKSYGSSFWSSWGAGLRSSGVRSGVGESASTALSGSAKQSGSESVSRSATAVPRSKTVVTIVDPLHATKKDVILEPPQTLLQNYHLRVLEPDDPLIAARLGEPAVPLFGCVRQMLDQIAARRKARLERYNARVAELQAIADERRRAEM